MAQFDVFVNPIALARDAYPFVMVLQSEFAATAAQQIVAPLVPKAAMPALAGRLTPVMTFEALEYVLLVPALTGIRMRDLTRRAGSLAAARPAVLAAIDYLFFGL
jgi:toxin CcdB